MTNVYSRDNYQELSRLRPPRRLTNPSSGNSEGDLIHRFDEKGYLIFDSSLGQFVKIDPGNRVTSKSFTFSSSTTWTVTHNFGTDVVGARFYNAFGEQIEPNTFSITDANEVEATFVSAQAGVAVVYAESSSQTISRGRAPSGHDISALSDVVSHWQCRESILGGNTFTDDLSNHEGTANSNFYFMGRPNYEGIPFKEGQVFVGHDIVDLANNSNLVTEHLADNAMMMWMLAFQHSFSSFDGLVYQFGNSANTSAENILFSLRLETGNFKGVTLRSITEHGGGINDSQTIGIIGAYELYHICLAYEKDVPSAGTMTIHTWLNGQKFFEGTDNNPDGGTSGIGRFFGSFGGTETPVIVSDIVFMSGSIPTDSQVEEQYNRGLGIY